MIARTMSRQVSGRTRRIATTIRGRRAARVLFALLAAAMLWGGPGCAAHPKVQVHHEQMTLPWFTSRRLYTVDPRAFIPMQTVHGSRKAAGSRTFELIVLENEYLRVQVAPEIHGAIVRAIYKPTGEDLFFFEGKAKDWMPFWESGVKASFPFREHGIGTLQPASYHVAHRPDGSVTLALWMEFSRHNQPYHRASYGRYSSMMLSQLVTLRPRDASFTVEYRITNPTAYRQGRQCWNDTFFPRNHTAGGAVQGADKPPIPSTSKLLYPAAYASHHAGRQFRRFDQAKAAPAAQKNTTSIFAWDIAYGFTGMWYPDANVNRLRLTDPKAAPGAKIFLAGDGRYHAGSWWSHAYNFVELWGGFDSLFEGVENWIGPGQARSFTHRFALVRDIGKVDFANDDAAVHVTADGPDRRVTAVTFRPTARLQATWDGLPLGPAQACAPDRPARFRLPADADQGRLALRAGQRVLLDRSFPLVIPDDKSRHAIIRRSVDGRRPGFYEMTDNGGIGYYRMAINKYPAASIGRGRTLYRDGRLVDAVRCLAAATRAHPDAGEAWHLRGAALLEQSKTAEARTALDRALHAEKPYPPAAYLRAILALADGDRNLARRLLGTLVAADTHHWEGRLLKAWLDAGTDRACRQASVAAAEDPADPRAQWVLAHCARAAGKHALAARVEADLAGLLREPGAARRLAEFQAATAGTYRAARRLRHFQISDKALWGLRAGVLRPGAPLLAAPGKVTDIRTTLLAANPSDKVPLHVRAAFAPHDVLRPTPGKIDLVLPPGERREIPLHLRAVEPVTVRRLRPLKLNWTLTAAAGGKDLYNGAGRLRLPILPKHLCPPRKGKITVDGRLGDWPSLEFDVRRPAQILNDAKAHTGPDDGRFRFGTCHDDRYLYVAVAVTDDRPFFDPHRAVWRQDGVEVRIDARPDPDRSDCRDRGREDRALMIAVSPPAAGRKKIVLMNPEQIPPGTRVAAVRTPTGYTVEIAVPAAHLDTRQSSGKGGRSKAQPPWKEFRLNVAVNDYDDPERGAQLWWKPDWRTQDTYPASGTFGR